MGYAHSLALGADGTLFVWGANSFGQLGTGDSKERSKPTPVAAFHGAPVVRIAAGQHSSYALTATGCVALGLRVDCVALPPLVPPGMRQMCCRLARGSSRSIPPRRGFESLLYLAHIRGGLTLTPTLTQASVRVGLQRALRAGAGRGHTPQLAAAGAGAGGAQRDHADGGWLSRHGSDGLGRAVHVGCVPPHPTHPLQACRTDAESRTR